jgi:hypothetical protein
MRQTLSLKTLSDTHQPAAAAPFSPVTVLPDVPASVTFNSLLHPSINKPAGNAKRRAANDTSCRVANDHLVLHFITTGMVEVNGIEPMTSCLQSRRSPN